MDIMRNIERIIVGVSQETENNFSTVLCHLKVRPIGLRDFSTRYVFLTVYKLGDFRHESEEFDIARGLVGYNHLKFTGKFTNNTDLLRNLNLNRPMAK